MPRMFDAGKSAYAADHRISGAGQQTRHYVSNSTLEHYGANPERYAQVSGVNYRMGSVDTNNRDRRIDNAFHREVFGLGQNGAPVQHGYDAHALARGGISHQQQLDAMGARFDAAKAMYAAGGGHQHYMMMRDFRAVAREHLGGDMRQFRM